VLLGVVLAGTTWGWTQTTRPFPGRGEAPPCVDTTYLAGDELRVEDVIVSVLNATDREGLARDTMAKLVAQGFGRGVVGTATTALSGAAEIRVDDVTTPAVRLLRPRLGRVAVVAHPEVGYPGVTVVLGDRFAGLRAGPRSVLLDDDAVVCAGREQIEARPS
jgi:hypothetical protein